jgi:hypothetical protein
MYISNTNDVTKYMTVLLMAGVPSAHIQKNVEKQKFKIDPTPSLKTKKQKSKIDTTPSSKTKKSEKKVVNTLNNTKL